MRLFGEERKQQDPSGSTGSERVLGRDVVGERHALPRSCTTFSGGRAFTLPDFPEYAPAVSSGVPGTLQRIAISETGWCPRVIEERQSAEISAQLNRSQQRTSDKQGRKCHPHENPVKQAFGTDRELGANSDRESSATRVERAVSGDVGAYINTARHAVRCAEQRRTQDVA